METPLYRSASHGQVLQLVFGCSVDQPAKHNFESHVQVTAEESGAAGTALQSAAKSSADEMNRYTQYIQGMLRSHQKLPAATIFEYLKLYVMRCQPGGDRCNTYRHLTFTLCLVPSPATLIATKVLPRFGISWITLSQQRSLTQLAVCTPSTSLVAARARRRVAIG